MDNCHAIFKVASSGMALVCSGFLLSPTPTPSPAALSSKGSVFPPAELHLGFLRPNLWAFLPLPPTPTESQALEYLKSLLWVPRMPPLCDKVDRAINQTWVLGGVDCPSCGSQTSPAWQVALAWIREGSPGPLPCSRHSCFSSYSRERHSWPPVKHWVVNPFS